MHAYSHITRTVEGQWQPWTVIVEYLCLGTLSRVINNRHHPPGTILSDLHVIASRRHFNSTSRQEREGGRGRQREGKRERERERERERVPIYFEFKQKRRSEEKLEVFNSLEVHSLFWDRERA